MGDLAVSVCDTCFDPGRCCRNFPLNVCPPSEHATLLEAMVWAASCSYYGPAREELFGLPFIPHERDVAANTFRWHCSNLQADGRCGDYVYRPEACVRYMPGTDESCTLYDPPPKSPSLPISPESTGRR